MQQAKIEVAAGGDIKCREETDSAERGDRRDGEMRHETGAAKRKQAEQRNKSGRADSLQEVVEK